MTQLVENFVDITYEIRSGVQSSTLPANSTNSELIQQILSNNSLLEALSKKTGLSPQDINNTVASIYYSAQHIQALYDYLNATQHEIADFDAEDANSTSCGGRMDSNNMIVLSFLPAVIIIIILSFVNTRIWKRGCCGGRPGLAIPVNLLDSYEDRYTYGFAFGATTSRIVHVILNNDYSVVLGEGFQEVQGTYPSYVKAILRIVAAFVVGISYYPFFACISTHQRLLGAIMGSLFATIWFLSYLFLLIDCAGSPDNSYTVAEDVLLQATSVLFHGLLLLAFIRVLIRSLVSKRRGMIVSQDEWKENYKYQHVKNLLKPVQKSTIGDSNGFKQKVISNVYRWKPDFKYSTRIVCIYIAGGACLYLVIVNLAILGRQLKLIADYIVDELQESDMKGGGTLGVDFDKVRDGIAAVKICWMVSLGLAAIKDLIMMGNMLSWYRGHILRLQRGDRSFLPYNMDNQAPVNIMVASFKFAGYQAGYIIWSFLITHIVVFLILSVIALGLIMPWVWGSFQDSIVASLAFTLLPTAFITLITIIAQQLMAKYLFLRNFGAMLALNNRRLFHIASYFLFFLNIFVGLFSCLIRIVYAIILGTLFLPRLQKSALPRDWELFDPGYKAYIGYLFLEHTHTNPVIFTFNRLMWERIDNKNDIESETSEADIESVHKVPPRRARNRWFLAVTLLNNPELRDSRNTEEQKEELAKKGYCVKVKEFKTKITNKIDAIRDKSVETKF